RLKRAAEAVRLRRGGVKGGKAQEAADQEEDHAAGGKAGAAEGADPCPLVGRQQEPLRHIAAPRLDEEGKASSSDCEADEAHQPLAEGLAHEPSRPVLGCPALAAAR